MIGHTVIPSDCIGFGFLQIYSVWMIFHIVKELPSAFPFGKAAGSESMSESAFPLASLVHTSDNWFCLTCANANEPLGTAKGRGEPGGE